MKKLFYILVVLSVLLSVTYLTAFAQDGSASEPNQWRAVFEYAIMLLVGALGAPITQFFKNVLGWKDRAALVLTGVISAVVAVAEVWLAGQFGFAELTLENFPEAFFLVSTAATFYYQLMKGVDNVFGSRGLLRGS